ncbi:IS5 family transposase [Brevundimonas intermedia]|uniref:IS5 family transposase n=1 Tax=Brevundimonas intermedia TaxID=74315 RepID=UPI003209929C
MSDAEWAFFEPFMIEKGPRRGRRPRDHRLVLDGVFWITRTGTAWRDLHSHFGEWNSVYRQFRRWTLAGVWDLMLEALNETGAGHNSVQMIDSTIIRAHQHAAGAKKGDQDQGLGRSRGGFSTKIHIRSNALGLPLEVTLSGGQVADVKGYATVMNEPGPQPRVLLADKGYDADFILADLDARGVAAVIPAKRSRKVQPVIDGHIYRLRKLVERCFSKLKHSRRLATRYDKTADSFLGFVLVASIRLWIRHFVHTT